MADWIEKVKPKPIHKVLDAYMKTRERQKENPEIKLPVAQLYLSNNSIIEGVILHVDFRKYILTIMRNLDSNKTAVSFLEMRYMKEITLFDLDVCKEFLEELEKV
jgi:hypothetical protein